MILLFTTVILGKKDCLRLVDRVVVSLVFREFHNPCLKSETWGSRHPAVGNNLSSQP